MTAATLSLAKKRAPTTPIAADGMGDQLPTRKEPRGSFPHAVAGMKLVSEHKPT